MNLNGSKGTQYSIKYC